MDLGAGPVRTFLLVTLPAIAPAVLAAALLVFALSIDDYVVTSFVAGRRRDDAAAPDLLDGEERRLAGDQRGLDDAARRHRPAARSRRSCSSRDDGCARRRCLAALGLGPARGALRAGRRAAPASRVLNLYIWSNYIAPETLAKFEARHGSRSTWTSTTRTRRCSPSFRRATRATTSCARPTTRCEVLSAAGPAAAARSLGAAAPRERRSRVPRPTPTTRATRYSVPYFWGTTGIAYSRKRVGEPVDVVGGALRPALPRPRS